MIWRLAFASLHDLNGRIVPPDANECRRFLPWNLSQPMQTSARLSNPRFVTVNGELLSRLRVDRGMTQLQLAKAAGYTERLVRKAEKGGRLDIRSIQNLAEALSQSGKPVLVERLIQDNLSVARLWITSFDTLGSEMLPVVKPFLSGSFVFHCLGEPQSTPFAGTFGGLLGFGKWLERYFLVVTHAACAELEFIEGADAVVARWMEVCSIGGIPCEPIRMSMYFRFHDGLITRIDTDSDTRAFDGAIQRAIKQKREDSAAVEEGTCLHRPSGSQTQGG